MRFVAAGLMVIAIAVGTSACCCPLDLLYLCAGGGGGGNPPTTALTAVSAVDRAKLEIPVSASLATPVSNKQRF